MAQHDALPAYLKARLQKSASADAEDEEVDVQDAEMAADEPQVDVSEPENEHGNANDDNAWKGRLKKVQEENEQLKLAAQNGRFVAEKLLQMQEREKQKDEELAQLRARLAEKNKSPEAEQEETLFSADERNALGMELGDDVVDVLETKLKNLRGQASVAQDVQALREELRVRDEQAKRSAWFDAMKTQIPEIQGLLQSNADFLAFLQDKRDFSGRTAFDVVEKAGVELDVEKIPLIRSWIDEFKGGGAKEKRKATPRPLGGGGHTHEVGRKRKAGDKEWALRNRLKHMGKRAELEKLIEQFDWS